MAIAFRCPNGHKLKGADEKAGQTVKCPKCGADAKVPEAGASSTDDSPAKGDIFEFLCPNGHQLTGPARLQGRPGQCPHCQAKFRIPSLEDTDDEYAPETADELGDIPLEDLQEIEEFPTHDASVPFPGASDVGVSPPLVEVEDLELIDAGEPLHESVATKTHALAQMFVRLWEEKQHGATVELLLEGDEILVPEWYSLQLSQSTHALFASKDPDGDYTMTVIAWDSVRKVVVGNIDELPDGMFE